MHHHHFNYSSSSWPLRHHPPLGFNGHYISPGIAGGALNVGVLIKNHAYRPMPLQPLRSSDYSSRDGEDNCSKCKDENNPQCRIYDFETKDVTIRGKAHKIRCSYLAEAPKFEGDLVKYMEKKKERDVPDRVVDMLISFINREGYSNDNALDEVTVCILASSVGAKSALQHSLANLKKLECEIDDGKELVYIIGCILLSNKVDDGLIDWLKTFLTERLPDGHTSPIYNCLEFEALVWQHPEVEIVIREWYGLKPPGDAIDEVFRRL